MKKIWCAGLALVVAASLAVSPVAADKIVVSPSSMQGWISAIQQGTSNYGANISTMPILEWVFGPGLPPSGDGSLKMQVFYSDSDPLSKIYIGTNEFSGVELKRITKLQYWTYVQDRDYEDSMPPMIELITDSGTGKPQQRRFWYYPWGATVGPDGAGPVRMRAWQEWDLLDPAGRWEMIGTSSGDYFGNWDWLRRRYDGAGESMKIQTPYVGDYNSPMNANLQLANLSATGLSIKIGSGKAIDSRYGAWWRKQSGVHAYVDKLVVGIDGVDYEYDFEFGTLPTVIINNKAAGDPIMAQAKNSFNFSVFGRVDFTDFTSDTFRVDDGSGNPILVKAVNHGVNPFEYVKATGRLTPNTTPPTLDSQAEKIEKLEGF